LNGRRVQDPSIVVSGDRLQFGSTVMKLATQVDETQVGDAVAADGESAGSIFDFQGLLQDGAIVPHFQGLVDLGRRTTWGYEVLGRSRLPGLRSPAEMFRAASQHAAEQDLSRLLRMEGVRAADHLPMEYALFLNTHPSELSASSWRGLLASMAALRRRYPARPLVLEIQEMPEIDVSHLAELRAGLRDLAIGLSFDDFGSGDGRLIALAAIRPEIVKFDARLIRDIHQATSCRQRTLRSLVQMVLDLGIVPLAEGIEHEEEATVCRMLGFKLAQGFLFSQPVALTGIPPRSACPMEGRSNQGAMESIGRG
jgi:EAL domain-containing protein (putative c-di-GMP-specific phosphodiesterase class I)